MPGIRRRKFISLLGGAAAWPLAASAQQPSKLPTIGFLGQSTPVIESRRLAAFLQRSRELGWIEGRTIAIEYAWGQGAANASPRSQPTSSGLKSTSSLHREQLTSLQLSARRR